MNKLPTFFPSSRFPAFAFLTRMARRGLAVSLLLQAVLLWAAASGGQAQAQVAVRAQADAESLFTSTDPRLHANKQVAYLIIRDLLEAGQWQLADRYLSERYIQHNPNAASGREAVVNYFVKVLGVKPKPIPERLSTPIAAVVAEGDLVTVMYPRTERTAEGSYTTAWYDTWRIVDGKADEHWDPALKGESPTLSTR
jgi:predicted SnoaL-like aldol condensation-catalyzing enzyme